MTNLKTAYCVKCKSKKLMVGGKEATAKNGRKMMKGKCGCCETKMCKFIKAK